MNVNGLVAVQKLTAMGYRFRAEGADLRYEWHGPGKPDPARVRPLLDTVRQHKEVVLAYLSRPTPPERVLVCADCPHFEANSGPNPREGWGFCRKRNKGQYGCKTACKAVIDSLDGNLGENL